MFSLYFRIVTSFLPSWYSMLWLPVRSLLQRFDDSKYRSTDLFWITLWGLSDQRWLCLVQRPGKSFIAYTTFAFVEIHASLVLLVCLKTRQIHLFVCLESSVPLENLSLIWRGYRCRRRAMNFDLCLALMATEQWEFLSVPHYCDTGHPFKMVISEGPWHSHLLPRIW